MAAPAEHPHFLDPSTPLGTAEAIPRRYERLWLEVTSEELFGPDERYRIEGRLERLNELGFDVAEMEVL